MAIHLIDKILKPNFFRRFGVEFDTDRLKFSFQSQFDEETHNTTRFLGYYGALVPLWGCKRRKKLVHWYRYGQFSR